MGTNHADGSEQVVVASVQTIGRYKKHKQKGGPLVLEASKRLLALNPDDFDAVIVDECHHAPSLSYRMIFRHFGFLDEKFNKTLNPPSRLLFGVTATPKRLDGTYLNTIFDKKTYTYPIEDAIREGFLVDLRCYRVKTTSNLAGLDISGEDLDIAKLAKMVDTPARNKLVVEEWIRLAKGRKTICFAVGVEHAKNLAAEFRKHKVKAEALWSGDEDKAEKLKKFKRGKIHVLVNCELLVEGFDDRSVNCILMARPTASEALFRQCVGRGTRLQDGIVNLLRAIAEGVEITKRDCLVIDVVDNTEEHSLVLTFAQAFGLPDGMDLEGGSFLEAQDLLARIEKRMERARRAGKGKAKPPEKATLEELKIFDREVLAAEVEEIDLLEVKFDDLVLQSSDLQWHRLGAEDFLLMLPYGFGHLRLYRNPEGYLVLDGSRLSGSQSFTDVGKVKNGSFADALAYADRKVDRMFGARVFGMCNRKNNDIAWKGSPASPAQISRVSRYFTSKGRKVPANITKGEASLLITMMEVHETAAAGYPRLLQENKVQAVPA